MIDFKALSGGQKFSLALFGSVIIIGSGLIGYKLLNPVQTMIFEDQSLAQVSKVTEQLDLEGIDYQLGHNGTGVLVADDQANKVKLKLAQASANAEHSVGFELFDNVDYSMTEHAQKVTYQRALQGELERTLSSYHEVAAARVHIMLPQRKLFALEQAKAKASVSLIMEPGITLTAAQVRGMQSVVAAAVEGLADHDVILLNGDGMKISVNKAKKQQLGEPQTDQQQDLERQLITKAQRLMGLYFQPDQIAVSVSIELSHVQTKKVQNSLLLNDDNQGFVSRKKESLSYRGSADDEVVTQPDKQSEIEYKHGTQTSEILSFAGAIKQLNVAIAISADIDDSQLEKLRALVSAGLGINITRGDRLSIESFEPLVTHQPTYQPTLATPTAKITPQPKVVKQSTIDSSDNQTQWLSESILIILFIGLTIVGLLVGILIYKRKALKPEQKQAMLLEFDQWIKQDQQQNQGLGEQHG